MGGKYKRQSRGSSGCEDQPAGDDCDCRQAVCWALVLGFGSLWIPSCGDHTVVRVDAETGIDMRTGNKDAS